ncbi:MAG: hypothetical protein FWE37_07255, partial [Spirochaetaceae bacterium]|nr:hypothetical protein [Spirochaetaceae bacterium]
VPLFIAALYFKSIYIVALTTVLWLWAFTATGGAGIILALLFAAKLKNVQEYALLFLYAMAVLTGFSIINHVHTSLFVMFIFAGTAVFLAVLQFKGLLAIVDKKMVVKLIEVKIVYLTAEQARIFRLCYIEGKADKEIPIPGITDPKEISTRVIQERQKAKATNRCTSKELAASVKAGAIKILKEGQTVPKDYAAAL